MASITEIVAQKKQEALQKLAAKVNATPAPIVQLDPAYDTGALGDNVTELFHVNLHVTNPAGLTWIDTTPNGAYDSGEPTAVGNTFYDVTLTPGNNQLVFYQAAPGKETSTATTLLLYVPPTATYNEKQLDQLVVQLGLSYLGRGLSPDELELGRQVLQQTSGNPQPIIDYLLTTAEYRLVYPAQDPLALITDPYLKLFGRYPTSSEITYWLTQSTTGVDLHQLPWLLIQNPPSASSDAKALAAKTVIAQLMTAHYEDLLQQTNGYEALLHAAMRHQLAAVHDQATMNSALTAIDEGTFATAWQNAESAPSDQNNQNDNSNAQGQTFVLTTGIDYLTGTPENDIFFGVFNAEGKTIGADGTSFNTADSVDGGVGFDTLSYIVIGDADGKGATNTLAPVNLKNIEAFSVRNLATDSNTNGEELHILDLSSVTGVTDVINNASTASIVFKNIGKAAAVTVDGVISGHTYFTRGTTPISDALTINIANGVQKGAIVSSDENNDATAVVINSVGAKNVVDYINVTGTPNEATHTVTHVTINAATDLTIGTVNGTPDLTGFDITKVGTIAVTGAGKVVLNELAGVVKTLNAGSNTAGVTAIGLTGNLQEVTGGAGNDSITLGGALNDKGFVKLGAGSDTLNIAAHAVNAGAVVDLGSGDDSFVGTGAVSAVSDISGGEGKDTLAAAVVNATNAGAFSSFEYLDLKGLSVSGGLDADLLAAKNTIEKLILSGDAGSTNAIINHVPAGEGLEIIASSNNPVTINQMGVTTGGTVVDEFALTFDAAAADPIAPKTVTLAGITLNGIDEVTIVSDGGEQVANVLTSLVSNEMKTLKITGDNVLILTNLYSAGTTKTTTLTTVDASGQTAGGLKMALGAVNGNLTVKLGGGDDLITAGINTTAGSRAADSTATALDKIANFDKATDAELAAGAGYDLVKLADANSAPVTFSVASNASGTTTTVGIKDGVVSFASLTTGPQSFADAVAKVGAVVDTAGHAAIFEYGGNSYLFVDVDGTTATTNDLVIELTGLTGATKLGILDGDSLYVMS